MKIFNLVKALILLPVVLFGTFYNGSIGRTPKLTYSCFRRIFYLTNGSFNDKISKFYSFLYPFKKFNIIESKLLGELDEKQLDEIVNSIENDGYYIFPSVVPQTIVDQLSRFAESVPCETVPNLKENLIFDKNDIKATKYGINEQLIIEQHVSQEIIMDKGLIEISGRYLKSEPINDLVSMWWSTNFSSEASNEAAQMFHFDMDRIKFLKYFIYLTDVNTDSGPHIFIRGSHKSLPNKLKKDGRFSDDEILNIYSQKDIIEIVGPKGTIVAVDTRGLHKGKPLKDLYRLIFQVEFSNSTFGMNYDKLQLNKSDCLNTFYQFKIDNPRFFKRYIFK